MTSHLGMRAYRHVGTRNRTFTAGATGILQDVLEDVIFEALETALDPGVAQEAPSPVQLEELGAYGVPKFMQPQMYGLLTSYDQREVEEGNMLLMHYQLDSIARTEARGRSR
jgi:hypothetical protein